MQRPNIFRLATSELSQDTIIAWLLQWSCPSHEEVNPLLHKCGSDLLALLIKKDVLSFGKKVSKVEAGRQWENIDIWAEIEFEDGDKLLLISEDKTYSAEHSDQLLRYKKTANEWCEKNNYRLACTYIKIGGESLKTLNAIADKGYDVFGRKEILECLRLHMNIKDSFVVDYIYHLQQLEEAHQTFLSTPPKEWHDLSWVGLYQYIESEIPINIWHWVNNPSGGFWNLSLNWEYWHHFPVYMQIEQGKLCFKIAVSEDETGLEVDYNKNMVQDFVSEKLQSFAKEEMFLISRPFPFVHRGNYRTIGVVQQQVWLGDQENIIDKEKIIDNLKSQLVFYKKFMHQLSGLSYEDAQITITQNEKQ